jgi:hypothetical protein
MAVRLACVLALLAAVAVRANAADKLSDLQARFDHEANSVHKAKAFERLGDQQFAEARHASQTRDYKTLAELMESYRDNARVALNALKKEHPNAERQMSGYKQLQMHIHRGVHEVEESILVSPEEFKPPLRLVRQDLSSMDDELLVLLFPRRPGEKGRSSETKPPVSSLPASQPVSPAILSQAAPAPKGEDQPEDQPADQPEAKPPEKEEEQLTMSIRNCLAAAVLTCGMGLTCDQVLAQQKDYLSAVESDKIRDAETTNERIRLFLTFADDRLKKFQYELQHPSSNKHSEMLNALMNGYVGCVDDAADLVQLGIEKQENIRAGIDFMASRTKEFLDALNKVAADKIEIDIYKDNLNDAIEGTRDAMNDAEKAKKTVAPPPVRRRS